MLCESNHCLFKARTTIALAPKVFFVTNFYFQVDMATGTGNIVVIS